MPRGLGEDPLSRKRRTASRVGSAAVATAGAASPMPNVADAARDQPPSHQLPTTPSYDEVFFQRREEVPVTPQPEPTTELLPGPVQTEKPLQSLVSEPTPTSVDGPPFPAADNDAPLQGPEPQKVGFLGRLLGKLRR